MCSLTNSETLYGVVVYEPSRIHNFEDFPPSVLSGSIVCCQDVYFTYEGKKKTYLYMIFQLIVVADNVNQDIYIFSINSQEYHKLTFPFVQIYFK